MKLKYWGYDYETGLTLTADLFKNDMTLIHSGFAMTEVNTCNYSTGNIFSTISPLAPGMYVLRIKDTGTGEFLSHEEFVFDGMKQLTLLDIQLMTDKEKMQFRDAIGIDGPKMIARGGQLQKKSEGPYNSIVDNRKYPE